MQLIMFDYATMKMLYECDIAIGSGSKAFILPTNFVRWSSQKCTWLLGYCGSSPDVTIRIRLLLPTICTTFTPPSMTLLTLKQKGSIEKIEKPFVVPIAKAS